MKTCTKCKTPKNLSEFNKQSRTKDGKHHWCRECQKEEGRDRYKRDPNRRACIRRVDKEFKKAKIETLAAYKIEKGCTDCGYNTHFAALDFDHVTGIKIANLSHMVRNGLSNQRIKEELDKCEVVCSNCHRIRAYNRIMANKLARSLTG